MLFQFGIVLECLLIDRSDAVRPDNHDFPAKIKDDFQDDVVGVRPSGALSLKVNASAPWHTGKRRFGILAASKTSNATESNRENASEEKLTEMDETKVQSLLERSHAGGTEYTAAKSDVTDKDTSPDQAPAKTDATKGAPAKSDATKGAQAKTESSKDTTATPNASKNATPKSDAAAKNATQKSDASGKNATQKSDASVKNATSKSGATKSDDKAGKGVASIVPSVIKFTDSLGYIHLLIFYGLLYCAGFGLWLCYRYQQAFKVNVSRMMRQVAMFYWRHPRMAPIGGSCALFLLADILGQYSGRQEDQGGTCWKLGLIFAAALYNAIWHGWFYRKLDMIFPEGDDGLLGSRIKRLLGMLLAHLVLYLPIGVPLFLASSDFFRRTFHEASSNCISSAIVAIPRDLGESTTVAANLVASSYGWSAVFWQLSNVLNFTVVQMWSPPFKSSWDGIVIVLWNLYILPFSGEAVGVGPLLVDRDVLTQLPKKEAAATNCDHTSVYAIFLGIYGIIYSVFWIIYRIIYFTGEYTYYFFCWLMHEERNGQRWSSYKIWESWCVVCYLVRITYMLAWLILSWGCTIVWRLLMFPLVVFDKFKWYIGFFFFPRLWDYDACPCPGYEFDASWTWGTIIWDGSLLGSSVSPPSLPSTKR